MSEAYFAYDALSNTGIKEFQESPYHYYDWRKNGSPDPNAAHFRIGHALHKKILGVGKEIEIFTATKTLNSKAGDAFLLANKEKTCLTQDEYEMVEGMTDALLSYPTIVKMLEGAQPEVEIYTEYKGIPIKAMLDLVTPNAILDIKTTADRASKFDKAIDYYGYHIQAVWYQFVYEVKYGIKLPFIFIAVEKDRPYGVALHDIDPANMKITRDQILCLIESYRECKKTNLWPRAPLEIKTKIWRSRI